MNFATCQLAVCPYCGKEKEIFRLLSGNTFGSVLWSDAKEVAPMCPSASPIQKCPRCGHFYFLEKVLLKEGDKYSEQKGWLDFEDALKANVELSSLSIEQEETLTLVLVWSYNDKIRNGCDPGIEQYTHFKNILESKLMLPIFQHNVLLKAELYREIEKYDECVKILNEFKIPDSFLMRIAKQILSRVKQADNKVFIIDR